MVDSPSTSTESTAARCAPQRIAIIAGETSGDTLAAGLIASLKQHWPDASFEGIAGPQMSAAGCTVLVESEKLAVMGLVEVLKHLRPLLAIRRKLLTRWQQNPPDMFIGVDAPDFNLPVEKVLKSQGVPTVHYVSPSVWAWRRKRLITMRESADLLLTLFPFEPQMYAPYGTQATFVGHPRADTLPLQPDRLAARAQLGLPPDNTLVALLPGSRSGEIQRHAGLFLEAAQTLSDPDSAMQFIVPCVHARARAQIAAQLDQFPELPVSLVDGQATAVMQACDIGLIASGTATLEALLCGLPMVVSYKIAPMSYRLVRWLNLIKSESISLPNFLAGDKLVPEILQDDATPDRLAREMQHLLTHDDTRNRMRSQFALIHQQLRKDASKSAALAIVKQWQEQSCT